MIPLVPERGKPLGCGSFRRGFAAYAPGPLTARSLPRVPVGALLPYPGIVALVIPGRP